MTAVGLSIVLPVPSPRVSVERAFERVRAVARDLDASVEIVVCGQHAAGAGDREGEGRVTVREVPASEPGFGPAWRAGVQAAAGAFVLTLDVESPDVAVAVLDLWAARERGEVVVASRYTGLGTVRMSRPRRVVSRALNAAFSRGLSLPVSDVSSAFRLYRADVLRDQQLRARDYDVLPESLVRALAGGWRVAEIPLRADPSRRDRTLTPLVRLTASYARTFGTLWQLRNSIQAGDYDARAHDSIIPLQRYWQRQRYRHVTDLIRGQGPVLDVGCGSSRIIEALPPGSVALDVLPNKLRYARRFTNRLVRASGFHLPFADGAFPCVLCSQVIEHVPMESPILSELNRVLAPGGRLVLGTPDYDRWEWVWTEKAYGFFKPGGYADEHIAHYTRHGLLRHFELLGFAHEHTRYILRGELILAFRKPVARGPAAAV